VYISVKTLKADNDVYSMMATVLQKDYNIQVETGKLKGRMREDRLLSNCINVYGKFRNKRGFL